MKIVTWNCNGAFRKKFHLLEQFDADICVIQECENPSFSSDKNYKKWALNFFWTGDNKNKGIGIFCRKAMRLKENLWGKDNTKYFISAHINNSFNVVGVWNCRSNSSDFDYIGQFWKYLQINRSFMSKTLIAGDFNSSKIWDKRGRRWNHSEVVRELEDIGVRSLYHEYFNEPQGKEKHPTLFFRKNPKTTYHIDYVFADRRFFKKVVNAQIGDKASWLRWSDHMPLIFNLKCSNKKK